MRAFTAFLRIRHPSIDPARLTEALGLEPAHAWAAGSRREATGGGGARGAHPDTYWIAPLDDAEWSRPALVAALKAVPRTDLPGRSALPLETFLALQVRGLAARRPFLARLVAEGGSVEIAVTLEPDGRLALDFPPALLKALGELGVGLSVEDGAATES